MCLEVFSKYSGLKVNNDKQGYLQLDGNALKRQNRSTVKILGVCFDYHNPSTMKANYHSIFKSVKKNSKYVEVQRSNLTKKSSNCQNFRYSKIYEH